MAVSVKTVANSAQLLYSGMRYMYINQISIRPDES